jgi:hypothetical protein
MRGDHAAAKELSLKAQDERAAAEKLNNKAAEEIFRLRNSNNDIWKVDMHGLHASEAVAILERHLHMMEFQPPGTSVASSDELAEFEAAYSESTTVEFATDKVVLRQPKQAILHVITGNLLILFALLLQRVDGSISFNSLFSLYTLQVLAITAKDRLHYLLQLGVSSLKMGNYWCNTAICTMKYYSQD